MIDNQEVLTFRQIRTDMFRHGVVWRLNSSVEGVGKRNWNVKSNYIRFFELIAYLTIYNKL